MVSGRFQKKEEPGQAGLEGGEANGDCRYRAASNFPGGATRGSVATSRWSYGKVQWTLGIHRDGGVSNTEKRGGGGDLRGKISSEAEKVLLNIQ